MPATCLVDLDTIATHIDAALPPDQPVPCWFLRLAGTTPDDLTIGLHPIGAGADHPIEDLLGFTADPSWTAAGVIVGGRAHDLAGPVDDTRALRVTYLVGRDGSDATVLRYLDDDTVARPGPAEGRVSDCLHRVLGLATPPPTVPTLHWQAAVWLDAVLAAVLDDPTAVRTWSAAVALHPLVTRNATPDADQLARLARRVASTQTWAELRADTIAGRGNGSDAMTPEVAAWMDDGTFARWRLAELPDPVDMLIDLAGVLPGAVTEEVVRVVEAWDLW